jgi:hypothetical protein
MRHDRAQPLDEVDDIAMGDERIVCGARCNWWDSIDKVAHSGLLPTCPHCGSVLFEYPSERAWFALVDQYAEKTNNPRYRAEIEWARGRCFRSYADLRTAYEAAVGAA